MKKREEVVFENKWNVEAFYASVEDWEKEFSQAARFEENPRWPNLLAYKGHLKEGELVLKEALQVFLSISRNLEKLYTYAHLRHDEETTIDEHKVRYDQALALLHDFSHESAWFEPEILSLSKELLSRYLKSSTFVAYRFYLEKMIRGKKYVLPFEQEKILALAGKSLETAQKSFHAINNSDFKFGFVLDCEGKERELSHGSYNLYLREKDRVLRCNAFKRMCEQFACYENTLAQLFSGQVQGHLFQTRVRGYSCCLESALFPKNIDMSVYRSLIEAVRSRIGVLHRYTSVRKKILGVEELHLYDMYVPLVSEVDMKMTYMEAQEAVIESVEPLGKNYQEFMGKGLTEGRWVDRYENANKRSGAYSSGCYDSMPYILMNFKGTLNDVFTLAHEAGHSMHSFLSRKYQPYHYAEYSIFVAEVASTFNEELLMHLMLNRTNNKEERMYLINQKIEDIRATLFRQTMFAEFELLVHESAEKGIPLTPTFLKEEYFKLNEVYFGKDVFIDREIEIEWARIPHFYYNFYVYQYATGISAALTLAEKVLQGGVKEREAYIGFLQGGYSRYPIDLLKDAGVDMTSSKPVEVTISKFESLVDELESLSSVVLSRV